MKVFSNRGQQIDMSALAAMNEHSVAVTGGGARMNARGDLLSNGGRVVKTREELAREYHQSNPNAVKNVSLKDIQSEVYQSPAEAVAAIDQANKEFVKKAPPRKIEDTED